MYTLRWKNPSIDANKAADIQVPVGAIVSNKASIRFTGKGAPGYGPIQQENLMRLLESFADSAPPAFPTVGQEWYDTATNTLKVCSSTSPLIWKSLGGIQVTGVGDAPPSPAAVGDIWFQRTGTGSGIMYVYTGFGRYPEAYPNVGGWNQVWPQVETIAGREEYDYVLGQVNKLAGNPLTNGGSGAIGKIVPQLPNLTILDNSIRAKYIASPDANIVTPIAESNTELMVDTNSSDWDLLLAAAKYAISRLDLPSSMLDDISPVPFVSDGRPIPVSLASLSTTDVRYPSLERRSNRRFGLVTLIRAFTETVNVINVAVDNRYSIKGIGGTTGTNPAFTANTEIVSHSSFSGSPGGASSGSINVAFKFNNDTDLASFLGSGGAIQMTITHNPGGSGTTADTNFKNLVDSRGVLRLTADKTRIFANVYPLAMALPAVNSGLKDAPQAGRVLTAQTLAGASYTVSAGYASSKQFNIALDFSSTGAMAGNMSVTFEVIRDKTTYATPALVNVYASPLAYTSGDKTGASYLV